MSIYDQIQKRVDSIGFTDTEINTPDVQEYSAPAVGKDEYEWYPNQIYTGGDRRLRLQEYEAMATYDLISSALDIYADNACQKDLDGKVVQIYSSDNNIQEELEELFYRKINIDSILWKIVRSLCLYGDYFSEIIIQQNKKGILYLKPLPPKTIWRVESNGYLRGFIQQIPNGSPVHFSPFHMVHWRLPSSVHSFAPYGYSVLEPARRPWRQLVLMEDAMVVYRVTKAPERRIFNIDTGNLPTAAADAFVEKQRMKFRKRSFINKNGQMDYRANTMPPDEDFWIAKKNGSEGTTIDVLPGACLSLDTRIPLLDGRTLPLNNIIDEYNLGKKLWAYSINKDTGEVVPGPITWAGVTRKDTEVVKVTFDNGQSIICTPDHKFPNRDGNYIEAKDLKIGESLWAFNTRNHKLKTGQSEYKQVWNHSDQSWKFVHKLVSNFGIVKESVLYKEYEEPKTTTHHIDFDRFNNNPENLTNVGSKDHWKYHSSLMTSERAKELGKLGSIAYTNKLQNPEYRKKVSERSSDFFTSFHNNMSESEKLLWKEKIKNGIASLPEEKKKERKERFAKVALIGNKNRIAKQKIDLEFKNKVYSKSSETLRKTLQLPEQREKMMKHIMDIRHDPKNAKTQFSTELFKMVIDAIKLGNIKQNTAIAYLNSNSSFMKLLKELNSNIDSNINNIDVSKFTVVHLRKMIKSFGYSNWKSLIENYNTFNHTVVSVEFLNEKIDTGTLTIDGNNELHGHHTFALECGVFTKNSNLSEVDDVLYFKDKIFYAIKVPRLAVQDKEGNSERRQNLAHQDIQFARIVERVQGFTIEGLKKIAIIHLMLRGFKKHQLDNFEITMTPPSDLGERQSLDLEQRRTEVAQALVEAGFSRRDIMNRVFNISTNEWLKMKEEREREKLRETKVEQGEDPDAIELIKPEKEKDFDNNSDIIDVEAIEPSDDLTQPERFAQFEEKYISGIYSKLLMEGELEQPDDVQLNESLKDFELPQLSE